jgi:hypothetical protein
MRCLFLFVFAGVAVHSCVTRYFVLLGALSAMGPLHILLAHGANIVAVDLNRPGIWEKLLKIASDSCGAIARSHDVFPLRPPPRPPPAPPAPPLPSIPRASGVCVA